MQYVVVNAVTTRVSRAHRIIGELFRIKYRFSDELISDLLELRWWDWPEKKIINNIDWLINQDVTKESISRMRDILEAM